jgi:hypothetical protein
VVSGVAFAAPGVTLKASAESAIAEAIASNEIVFIVGLQQQNCLYENNMAARICGCDYQKIYTGSFASSRDEGALRRSLKLASIARDRRSESVKSYLMETDIGLPIVEGVRR